MKKPKLLINGCSHTRAEIPDNPKGDPWPTILGKKASADIINIANDGKSNQVIVEETIRYLINRNDVDHVVIQLNEWKRLNFFKKECSFEWSPKDLESQISTLSNTNKKHYSHFVKIPAVSDKDLKVTRLVDTPKEEVTQIGDLSFTYEIITIGTLVNCLSQLCKRRNIGLTIITFYGLKECRGDPVWSTIPENHFLIQNRAWSGLYNHLLWLYDTPDTFHFEHSAHYYIANVVYEHYINGTQIRVKKEDYDSTFNNVTERIFSYE